MKCLTCLIACQYNGRIVLSELSELMYVIVRKRTTTNDGELHITSKCWILLLELLERLDQHVSTLMAHETRTHHQVFTWLKIKWLEECWF